MELSACWYIVVGCRQFLLSCLCQLAAFSCWSNDFTTGYVSQSTRQIHHTFIHNIQFYLFYTTRYFLVFLSHFDDRSLNTLEMCRFIYIDIFLLLWFYCQPTCIFSQDRTPRARARAFNRNPFPSLYTRAWWEAQYIRFV